jgi:hypothetical protein
LASPELGLIGRNLRDAAPQLGRLLRCHPATLVEFNRLVVHRRQSFGA